MVIGQNGAPGTECHATGKRNWRMAIRAYLLEKEVVLLNLADGVLSQAITSLTLRCNGIHWCVHEVRFLTFLIYGPTEF